MMMEVNMTNIMMKSQVMPLIKVGSLRKDKVGWGAGGAVECLGKQYKGFSCTWKERIELYMKQ